MSEQEQRPPEEVTAENELICRQLLGWTRSGENWSFRDGYGQWYTGMPTFTDWASAGLILDALVSKDQFPRIGQRLKGDWFCVLICGASVNAESGPLTIRTAALAYIQVLNS